MILNRVLIIDYVYDWLLISIDYNFTMFLFIEEILCIKGSDSQCLSKQALGVPRDPFCVLKTVNSILSWESLKSTEIDARHGGGCKLDKMTLRLLQRGCLRDKLDFENSEIQQCTYLTLIFTGTGRTWRT